MIKSSYYHYSKRKLAFKKALYSNDGEFNFNQGQYNPSLSPNGFWISTNSEWERKLIMDNQNICKHYKYRVSLKEKANLFIINNTQELIDFSLKYASTSAINKNGYILSIDYNKFTNEYDGLLIPNHLTSVKFYPPTMWYYLGWSCGGGCIFNAKCIEEIYDEESILTF